MAVERLVVADRTAFLRRPDHRVVRAAEQIWPLIKAQAREAISG